MKTLKARLSVRVLLIIQAKAETEPDKVREKEEGRMGGTEGSSGTKMMDVTSSLG